MDVPPWPKRIDNWTKASICGQFASLINENFSNQEKEALIERLWQVVLRGREKWDAHEHYLMNKLYKLLRLSPQATDRCKNSRCCTEVNEDDGEKPFAGVDFEQFVYDMEDFHGDRAPGIIVGALMLDTVLEKVLDGSPIWWLPLKPSIACRMRSRC